MVSLSIPQWTVRLFPFPGCCKFATMNMGKMQISFPYNGFISFEKYPEMDFFWGTSIILHSGCNNLQSHHQCTSVAAMRWAWRLGLRKCAVSLRLWKSAGAAGAGGAFWVGLAPGMSGLLKSTGESWEGRLGFTGVPPLPEPTMVWGHGILQGDTWISCQTPNHVRGLSSWEPSEVT